MEAIKRQGLKDFMALLDSKNMEYTSYEHEAADTSQKMMEVLKLKKAPYIKNIFYKLKKGGPGFALLMAIENTQVKNHFWKEINMTHNHVRNAKAEDLDRVLKCYKGCVNPLSLVNDTENEVKIFVADKKIQEHEYVSFHPGENTGTLEMKRTDFETLMAEWNRKIYYLDLEQDTPKDEGKAGKKGGKGKKKKKGGKAQQDEEGTKLKIMCKKEEDFAGWYTEVIKKADMIEYYDVSGCYVIRPHAYYIWQSIMNYLDPRFQQEGAQNCYFPMFVTKAKLEAEEDHVEGFAPEVAWVTKAGTSDLQEPIAIRPTSETIMYPVFAKWIRSHRDLPLKVN